MPRLMPRPLRRALTVPVHNPDFPATDEQIDAELARMRAQPRSLPRPVVVVAGYRGWKIISRSARATLASLTGAPLSMFLPLAYPLSTDIPAMARRVVAAVDRRWPSGDPERTVEVDYVGISMGGLLGRLAACAVFDSPGVKRLRVRRLFTLGTPHRGAILAERIAADRAARDMRPGSDFLRRLDERLADADYELIPYTRLRDGFVGASRTAPPGREPIWVSGLRTRYLGHVTTSEDERILADIARRLRGEEPLARAGSAPPRD